MEINHSIDLKKETVCHGNFVLTCFCWLCCCFCDFLFLWCACRCRLRWFCCIMSCCCWSCSTSIAATILCCCSCVCVCVCVCPACGNTGGSVTISLSSITSMTSSFMVALTASIVTPGSSSFTRTGRPTCLPSSCERRDSTSCCFCSNMRVSSWMRRSFSCSIWSLSIAGAADWDTRQQEDGDVQLPGSSLMQIVEGRGGEGCKESWVRGEVTWKGQEWEIHTY